MYVHVRRMAKRRWKVYSLHTLDGAAALLNSNKHFPSHVSVKESSVQHLDLHSLSLYHS